MIRRSLLTAAFVSASLLSVSAMANTKAPITQRYTPQYNAVNTSTQAAYQRCGYGTHIKIVNLSHQTVFVRVPAAGGPDLALYPVGSNQNVDYIESDDTYARLRVMILADDDQTVLFNRRVKNCTTKYVQDAAAQKQKVTIR